MIFKMFFNADPFQWPFNGDLKVPRKTCLIIIDVLYYTLYALSMHNDIKTIRIDMQVDFCGEGGYVDKMGFDLNVTHRPIEPIQNVLECMRKKGYPIFHTCEGHRADLSDCYANSKLWTSYQSNAEIGSKGPLGSRILVRGKPGWEIIPKLKTIIVSGEVVIYKRGHSAFVGTELDLILQNKGIHNVILAGVTTDVCVFSTMQNANHLGYEYLLLQGIVVLLPPTPTTTKLLLI